jgi:hypothetical protein
MPHSALVLGSGRSGTSLLTGLFHPDGYFSGSKLWPGTMSNPLGYFEDEEINGINEDLLDQVVPWRPRGVAGAVLPVFRTRPRWSQRWLATLPADTVVRSTPSLAQRMSRQTATVPYLFKDPRFSYTLPAWLPHLAPGTRLICTFREPQRTVDSILKIIRDERYLRDLRMSRQQALDYWVAIYQSVLGKRESLGGRWMFVHYDELLSQRAIGPLEEILGARADVSMLHGSLSRSSAAGRASPAADRIYGQLVRLAEQKY